VPESERPCPKCGAERKCAFHETTPVIDLEPAEVYVRLDIREVLACGKCDAEMQRAPSGDKVVAGGMYGATLVATLIVDKYKNGMPLHRQGEVQSAVYLYTSTGKKTGQRPGEIGPEDFLAERTGYVCADASGLFDASFASGKRSRSAATCTPAATS